MNEKPILNKTALLNILVLCDNEKYLPSRSLVKEMAIALLDSEYSHIKQTNKPSPC